MKVKTSVRADSPGLKPTPKFIGCCDDPDTWRLFVRP